MMRNIIRGEYIEETYYTITFDDGCYNGFSFPCDKDGNPDTNDMNYDSWKKNYEYCMSNPDKFVRYNKILKRTFGWREPSHGECSCGETVYLVDEYMGACECPNCGQWYNLAGQELLPPDKWGWDGTPLDDYY